MALGFAVAQRHHADSTGHINRRFFRELNDLPGPPLEWIDRPKFGNPAAGLIPGHRAPDDKHGGVRHPYGLRRPPPEPSGALGRGVRTRRRASERGGGAAALRWERDLACAGLVRAGAAARATAPGRGVRKTCEG
jgi:hypothetical protein